MVYPRPARPKVHDLVLKHVFIRVGVSLFKFHVLYGEYTPTYAVEHLVGSVSRCVSIQ